jgi:hypothetical protein
MSYLYSFFSQCDCILVEMENVPNIVPTSLWQSITKNLLGTSWKLERKIGRLRYFILRNCKDGYFGIERDLNFRLALEHEDRYELENITWHYKDLKEEDCRKVLRERCHSILPL